MKETENKNVDIDYEYSRKTYYELIEKSKESLDLMLEVAKESEHPRAFEVLGNMIKQISDVNDKLLDVNIKMQKAKSQDDALQIVEQIFPFFTPQYTVTVKPFSNITDLTEDVPITLTSTNFSDDFEGSIEQRRTIIYTLSFEMKINFYGPLNQSKIIREVSNNLFIMDSSNDSGDYLKTIQITPTPAGVSADSDYGFNQVDSDNPTNV